jgi:hypothetical protein
LLYTFSLSEEEPPKFFQEKSSSFRKKAKNPYRAQKPPEASRSVLSCSGIMSPEGLKIQGGYSGARERARAIYKNLAYVSGFHCIFA